MVSSTCDVPFNSTRSFAVLMVFLLSAIMQLMFSVLLMDLVGQLFGLSNLFIVEITYTWHRSLQRGGNSLTFTMSTYFRSSWTGCEWNFNQIQPEHLLWTTVRTHEKHGSKIRNHDPIFWLALFKPQRLQLAQEWYWWTTPCELSTWNTKNPVKLLSC